MPKDRKDSSKCFDRNRASPYTCSSSRSRRSSPRFPFECEKNIKEWEEARCPVCMEHPHNAVLLICTSHDKGCRPYMCDTSYRHSNCLDQFRKSCVETLTTHPPEENIFSTTNSSTAVNSESTVTDLQVGRTDDRTLYSGATSCDNNDQLKLVCPLCRGHIKEWIVMEAARHFMNTKPRSCSCETCDFSGTYSDLRKHARIEHPLVRPSEVDPERQRNWRRLERQRDLGDLLSTLQSSVGEERGDESILPIDDGGWLTVFFLIRVFRPGSSQRISSWSGTSRARARLSFRRRSTRLWGETHEGEPVSSREEENDSSDGDSDPWNRSWRVSPRTTPDQ
ncbi:hypothetical protein K2173_016492 [Erythroxylum novogranatense]|uniref:Uncharacterized protein n=1 Tax=Erythroxylum novogranatense TaxID=1862640 RepID=A0AAV8SH07_9ROSI|nr:hypothetical protein K2173_016492 [Erythroxylum novogranatense]